MKPTGKQGLQGNINLLSDLVNSFDATHITAAGKHSVPLQMAFYQPASRLLL